MRTLIVLFIFIGSAWVFANPIEKKSAITIARRLDRLESEINRVAQLPSKKRLEISISIRLRRLENRIAAVEIDESTRLSLSHRIQEARKKVKTKETTVSTPMANGVIKGRVRDAETGKAIGSGYVEIDIYDSQGNFHNYGYADDRGRYEVGRLSEGTYYAVTYGVQEYFDYVDQLYDGIQCYDSQCSIFNGKPITVTYGNTTTGINFDLVHGAHVTGQVVDAKTIAPIADQEVDIYDSTGTWGLYSYVDTDESGFYDTGGYDTGVWYASTFRALGTPYIDELYFNINCWALQCNILNGTPIPVTIGETTSGIDFSLDEGGRFSGGIVDANNNLPTGQIRVDLYDSKGEWIDGYRSDADGYYEIPGLVTGNYFAVAGDHYDCYHDEIYDDVPCSDEVCPVTSGTPIAVITGQMTSGIDFALAPYEHITGRIIDAESNAPLNGIQLLLYDLNGVWTGVRNTDSNGVYHIGPTDPGTYFLRTLSNRQRMDLLFNGISCFDQPCVPTDGTPIVVNEGNVTSGIDFALESCLYCLDFENFFDYEYLPDRWTVLKPSWKISDGSLIGSSSLRKSVIIASPVFAGCSTCSVKATMKTEGGAGSALYLLGWYEDHRNTIELIMKQEAGKWILRQHVNGAIVASASAQFNIQPDVFYNVEITNNGSDLDLKVDGVPILILRPVGNLFGTVGFKVKNTTGYFGALVVKEYKADQK